MPVAEPLPGYLDHEVFAASVKLLRDVLYVRDGESVLITNDTSGDDRVSRAIAAAAFYLGALPIELRYPTAANAGTDPPAPIAAALNSATVWVELNRSYILDSHTQKSAQAAGVRYICLTGVDVDTLVRTVGRVNLDALFELGQVIADVTNAASHVEMSCSNGTSWNADYRGRRALVESRSPDPGAVLMLGGQTNFIPIEASVNGLIVIDGSIWPPDSAGILMSPVRVEFVAGQATSITGGWQASRLVEWLEGFHDQTMLTFSHFSYGYNPGVLRPSGRVAEDERVFGCVCIGLGSQTMGLVPEPLEAPSHTDLTILRPTILLDDVEIERDGHYVHPELARLSKALAAPGY